MATTQTLYQNERRKIELTLTDSDTNLAWAPSAAFVQIVDDDDTVVVTERTAAIDSNKVSTIVGTTVTANPGRYYMKWRFRKSSNGDTYTYRHKTLLDVVTF